MLTQQEWVEGCYAYYAENGYEPGNPEDGEWEDAHYPVPKCEGGEVTIKLLKQHHAVQGVLQSEEYQRPCIWGWEANYLQGEMLALCEKWMLNLRNGSLLTPEQRRERSLKAAAAQTPEQRRAARLKAAASKTPEERSAIARRREAAKTLEQRSEAARKAAASKTTEQKRAAAMAGVAARKLKATM
jgi:hypothetical protein